MRMFKVALLATMLIPVANAGTRPLLNWVDQLSPVVLPGLTAAVRDALNVPLVSGGALQYALHVPLPQSSDLQGQWLQDGDRQYWRQAFSSPGALSLSVSLQDLRLPAGSVLRIADAQGVVWSETAVIAERSRYQTPIVPGELLFLEVEMPADAQDAHIGISGLQHGYRDWSQTQKSGSCNVDTVCSSGDAWLESIRATARITVDGTSLCSAVLLNNTAQDGEPLLLTADHCGLNFDNAHRTVVYWNYETSRCGGSPDGNLRQNQSGASLLARNANPDFALLRLDELPPASYNVFYAGWDSRGGTFSGGVSVHHPRGHEKRISFFERTPRKVRALVDGDPVQSWEVFWSDGVTEPGSSGSGLFDEERRVVGQLSGGNSSCENPDGSDVYGRIDYAWDTSSDPAQSLKAWLDPERTGQLFIDGLDGGDSSVSARRDDYRVARNDEGLILPVLQNDFGLRPLQIISATASGGQVQPQGQELIYTPDAGTQHDVISYQVMDRFGGVSEAQAVIEYEQADSAAARSIVTPGRGGATGFLTVLGLLLLGPRRKTRPTLQA